MRKVHKIIIGIFLVFLGFVFVMRVDGYKLSIFNQQFKNNIIHSMTGSSSVNVEDIVIDNTYRISDKLVVLFHNEGVMGIEYSNCKLGVFCNTGSYYLGSFVKGYSSIIIDTTSGPYVLVFGVIDHTPNSIHYTVDNYNYQCNIFTSTGYYLVYEKLPSNVNRHNIARNLEWSP